ncbi:CD70 antigen [Nannospalax galili]|uniref:CD70 antigen n=1 Tax=Nannospalax galili TaxID=1026970 RepID=UPI0004ED3B0A|nr:CD70 antigen [Nannospalax galili]
MQRLPQVGMAEEGPGCPWALPRLNWMGVLRYGLLLVTAGALCCFVCRQIFLQHQQQKRLELPGAARGLHKAGSGGFLGLQRLKGQRQPTCVFGKVMGTGVGARRLQWEVAELQFNHTGPRKEPMLLWDAGPALGRSFSHGPELDQGQLRVHRGGIYRLHIQVTLANCSPMYSSTPRKATLAVGICSPVTRSISLLRLHFGQGCTVSSQRLTPLAHGDVLCTNLTLPLLPSPNTDETFFGIQWVHP